MKFYGPDWLRHVPDAVDKLSKGESIVIGNKIYRVCPNCRRVVQINKSVFGSAHFCD